VKTQIWIALPVDVLVASSKGNSLDASLHSLQILSLTLIEKLDLAEALTPSSLESKIVATANRQNLFDF
jgi:hypothetical protein